MDINFDEIFDIETGAESAEEAAEPAEPAEEAQDETREDAAEPAQEPDQEKKPEQTPEERARQAEGRRRREAEEAGRRAAQAEFSAVIARLGFMDPNTGEAVDTYDKLKAYEAKLSDDRIAAGNPTREDIRRVAVEAVAAQQRAAEPQEPDPRLLQELAQIKAMDPEMVDLQAILRSDCGERFRDYVQRGLSFLDAFKLAAEQRIAQRRSGAAAEAARVQAASKDHLSGTKAQGTGAVAVPRDVMAYYREFLPEASEAEIQRHYNADRKRYGKT